MKRANVITDIDIKDFDVLPVRELYKAKPRSYVQLPLTKHVFYFDHIDGSYSYCIDMLGDVTNLAAWTPVHPLVRKESPDAV